MSYRRIIDFSDGGEARFFESEANGSDYTSIRGPKNLSETSCLTIRVGIPEITATPYEVADGDRYLMVDDDAIGGPVTINLPPAAQSVTRELSVKKLGTTGEITIDGFGSEPIDDDLTKVLSLQHDCLSMMCDGSNWWII